MGYVFSLLHYGWIELFVNPVSNTGVLEVYKTETRSHEVELVYIYEAIRRLMLLLELLQILLTVVIIIIIVITMLIIFIGF
jgi:hypothetical protein